MEKLTLKELAVPMIKAIDSFNYLLKSHHRRTAVISYNLGVALGLDKKSLSNLVIAASIHDIGALSVQERDMLIKEDVENPTPHCMMGYKMLATFDLFADVAQIIKHHHINYEKSLKMKDDEIPFESFILHLSDRIDISIDPNNYILDQKELIVEKMKSKSGKVFHPKVVEAFEKVSSSTIFWMDINNITMTALLEKIDFVIDLEMDIDKILEFALTISRIIDFRSKFTAAHSYTVAHLAKYMASLLGYDDEVCKKLEIAGYLHDIGKIGIDPSIIEKNGSLTEQEFNMMKLHPYYTGQILGELNSSIWFRDIVNWSKNHHEKIDGSGYPLALDKTNIDEPTLILQFADIITALLEDRPYRKGLEVNEAFEIIRTKLAEHISMDLFYKIVKHQDEIKTVVYECQEYRKNLKL